MSIQSTEAITVGVDPTAPTSALPAQAMRRIAAILKRTRDAICAYKQRKANEAILSMLDEHTLRDIGLTRSDIEVVAPRLRFQGPLAPHALHF